MKKQLGFVRSMGAAILAAASGGGQVSFGSGSNKIPKWLKVVGFNTFVDLRAKRNGGSVSGAVAAKRAAKKKANVRKRSKMSRK